MLAARLTEDPDARVLLLEAGPVDHAWDWRLHMPAALAYPLKGQTYNWHYQSEPEPFLDGRRIHCPRGRVLGGSSSINGMAYVRGHARDYDRWAQAGLLGGTTPTCCPTSSAPRPATGARRLSGRRRAAPRRDRRRPQPALSGVHRGRPPGGLSGHRRHERLQQEGFGAMDRTTHRGRRWSAAKAYLRPALERPNLVLHTRALSTRIRFEGLRASGVDYALGGQLRHAPATREVILSGGAINSPQLLLLSGIGDADQLTGLGIEVTADRKGVGRNLQDHMEIYVQHACTQPISLYGSERVGKKL